MPCGKPRRIADLGQRPRKWRFMESPENDKTVFRPSHKSWKSLADCNGVLKIMPSDFHIPSATTATAKMTQIQNQKGHNPASPNLRTFRLILQLEKTAGTIEWKFALEPVTPSSILTSISGSALTDHSGRGATIMLERNSSRERNGNMSSSGLETKLPSGF